MKSTTTRVLVRETVRETLIEQIVPEGLTPSIAEDLPERQYVAAPEPCSFLCTSCGRRSESPDSLCYPKQELAQ